MSTYGGPRSPRPFPWSCIECGGDVVLTTFSHTTRFKHDGNMHEFEIPELHAPKCEKCDQVCLDNDQHDQIEAAKRQYLAQLTPRKEDS